MTGARFKITLGMCLMTVVLTHPAITSAQDAVSNAVSCLAAKQNPDGSWGAADGTQLRQTSTVLDAFTAVAPLSPMGATISQGAAFLNSAAAPNQDDLARQIATLSQASVSLCGGLITDDACAPGGIKAGYLVATLLQGQESETQDLTRADYPAGAWGVGSKYASEALTTALALAGVQNAGVPTGLAVVQALVQAGTPLVHQFNLPADASNLTLLIRSVTGTVRLHIQTPSSGTFTTDLTNISTPSTLNGLPVQAGPYVLTVESLAGSPNSYSLEARYATTDVDVGQVSRALSYLGFAQNLDGSWGIRRGESGLVVTTAAAVQTLQRYGASFAPAGALSAGASWLAMRQNADGGFGGSGGVSTVPETALAILAIVGTLPASPTLAAARTFLLSTQGGDGCWNDDPYATALALRALAEAVVAGTVTLQGRPIKPNTAWSVPLQVSINPTGQANPVLQFTPTTDQNGTFTLSGIAPGTYDVHVKNSHTLRSKQTVTVVLGSNPVNVGTLREGDANNDNFVTLTDFSILATTFGKCQGAVGFDARADFNQSGCVNIQDFSLLATNFGKAGDP